MPPVSVAAMSPTMILLYVEVNEEDRYVDPHAVAKELTGVLATIRRTPALKAIRSISAAPPEWLRGSA